MNHIAVVIDLQQNTHHFHPLVYEAWVKRLQGMIIFFLIECET